MKATTSKLATILLIVLTAEPCVAASRATLWTKQIDDLTFGVISPSSPAECVSTEDESRHGVYELQGEPGATVRILLPSKGGLILGRGSTDEVRRHLHITSVQSRPANVVTLDARGKATVHIGACREAASATHEEGRYHAVLYRLRFVYADGGADAAAPKSGSGPK